MHLLFRGLSVKWFSDLSSFKHPNFLNTCNRLFLSWPAIAWSNNIPPRIIADLRQANKARKVKDPDSHWRINLPSTCGLFRADWRGYLCFDCTRQGCMHSCLRKWNIGDISLYHWRTPIALSPKCVLGAVWNIGLGCLPPIRLCHLEWCNIVTITFRDRIEPLPRRNNEMLQPDLAVSRFREPLLTPRPESRQRPLCCQGNASLTAADFYKNPRTCLTLDITLNYAILDFIEMIIWQRNS